MDFSQGAGEPVFRGALLGDLGAIAAIETTEFAQLSYPYFVLRQLFDLHGSHWVVAELGGDICGYAMVAVGASHHAWVIGLAVAARCRGRGYGRALLDRAVTRCRAALVEQVYITVRPTDQPAANLYKKSGFVRTGHEERYFGPGEPRDVLVHRIETRPHTRSINDPTSEIWRKGGRGPI